MIHRYFWPDTPLYASLLRHLADALASDGHRVTVVSTQPSYTGASARARATERLHSGVEVRRFRLLPETRTLGPVRALNAALFAVRVLVTTFRLRKVDVVMAATAPPVVAARVGSWVARLHRADFVYHNQDIYPEVGVAAGVIRRARLARLLRRLDTTNHRRASRIVVLSGDMRATVESRGIPADRIVEINNFAPFDRVADVAPARREPVPPLRVAFAGNLGRFQGLEAIVDAAFRLHDDKVVFDVIGDGALFQPLEAEAVNRGLDNVTFHGYRPAGEVERFLAEEADLGIVTLAPGVIRAAYPSKTFSYLQQGCPVVALVEADSELAATLEREGIGFHCAPGDGAALADVLRSLASNPSQLCPMRERASAFARRELSETQRLAQWRALFESLGAER